MNWIPNIFRRGKLYDDLSEEIRLHIEERTEQLMGEGMSAEEARRKARRGLWQPHCGGRAQPRGVAVADAGIDLGRCAIRDCGNCASLPASPSLPF